ncbi:histidine-rich glycoprotein isoform X5 [Canis lupus familiaris]|uniref:histidine-rich glycoprotein isoform X5 n=1 Tax=Canis lupus familiaris TaxID=9615 RepID=UPI0018F36F00|nr:histidine-rich glycoprotein isoform X5 [Canis lupus familiaris]XP_038439570.1 histidine-rich glycoprotein isoform X4 [Canis lupus familiaris]
MYYSKGWFSHFHKMRAFPAALLLLPLVALPSSCAVIPTDCDATESFAEKALDLINKGRRHGYLFQLLQVADAHVDESESVAVYYLVLDVKESDCSVLSRKHWNDCKPALSARLSDIVIGQCKVIATKCLNESQYLRVNDFNCTTSSVSSALANTKDSSILFDFFEDTQPYRTQADKALEKYKQENGDFASFKVDRLERVVRARGGERTNYYVDFSVRNCSVSHHFHRHHNAFGFCRADLSYDIEVSDLESPKDIAINCEVFNFAEHRNFSGKHHHFGHPHGPPPHGPPPHGPPPHGHHPHGPCPHGRPPFGPPPHGHPPHGHHPHGHPPHGHHPHGHPPHKHHPHGHHPHGHPPHEHHPHGHPPHGPPPHGPPPHEHHPHGHPPHGPPPHGPPPHEHHPHGHPPHGPPPHGPPPHEHHPHGHHPHKHHPHDHDFLDHGPCDLPPHSQSPQDHHRQGQGPPPQHSEERGPGKKHFPFHRRQIGYVYRLPPLKKDEVLPLPEANFPSFSLPDHSHPLKPEIQPFPESVSESCPGVFKNDFSNISKFFAYSLPK